MGEEDVGIGKSSFKHEPKDVSIKLVAFHAHMVILSQLVIPVHPSHVALIQCHCYWTLYLHPTTIMLTMQNRLFFVGLSIGGEKCDNSVVTPYESHNSLTLYNL